MRQQENETIRINKDVNICEYLTLRIKSFPHDSLINELPCLHCIFCVNVPNYCTKINSFRSFKSSIDLMMLGYEPSCHRIIGRFTTK